MKRLALAAVGAALVAVALAACAGAAERAVVVTATPPPATATPKPSWTPSPPTSTATPPRPEPTRTPQADLLPTEPPEPISTNTPVPPPTTTPMPPPPPTGTPVGPSSANGVFDVTALVDPQGRQVPQEDIARVFSVAASRLLDKTGQRMQLLDTVYGLPRGSSVSDLVDNYLRATAPYVPEGIVILSEDQQARAYGGYSFFRHLPPPFLNEFKSPRPEVGGDAVYVAVIHFDHFFARCGYDDNWNHLAMWR